MGKAFLYGNGGGGTGGTLVVTAPAGVTVTATNAAIGKTYKRTANADGIATFKGLVTGVWSLTISDGETTSTPVSVEVNADYEITLAFFSAEIVATYPANSTCTCSDGTTTFTDTNGTDAEKTVTFNVPNEGEWTITATASDGSDKTKNKTVEITTEGQSVSVSLSYEYYVFKTGFGVASEWKTENGAAAFADVNATRIRIGSSEREGSAEASAGSVAKHNTTPYTKLNFDINCDNLSGGNFFVGIASTTTGSSFVASKKLTAAGRQTVTVDIAKYNGEYYVKAYQTCWPSSQLIYNIWFE